MKSNRNSPGNRLDRDASTERSAISLASLVFSAKEAFYKAQYCLSRAWVDFHDVEVRLQHDAFDVELLVSIEGLARAGECMPGHFAFYHDYVFTAVAIPA